MAEPVEQQIIDSIVSRLSQISIANGFHTDIGQSVEDSRPKWNQDSLPAISVFQGAVTSSEQDDEGYIVDRTMTVMIRLSVARQDDAADDAKLLRRGMADIYKAIGADGRWIVNDVPLALYTTEKIHGPEYVPETDEISGAQVEFEIVYRGSYFNLEG